MALSDKNLVSLTASEHIDPEETGDNIAAKRVASYVWNPNTLQWERMTQSGGGAGGDVNLNEVGGISFALGQKDNVGSLPTISSADTTRIDEADSTHTYIGAASPGSVTSDPVWQVKLIDTSSGTAILFANGSNAYNSVWDDRIGLNYS